MLPIEVIMQIMSKLPYKFAVRNKEVSQLFYVEIEEVLADMKPRIETIYTSYIQALYPNNQFEHMNPYHIRESLEAFTNLSIEEYRVFIAASRQEQDDITADY